MENVVPYLPLLGWILALAALALTVVVGVMVAFHWFRFAMNPHGTALALIAYISISAAFIVMVFGALLVFIASI